MKGINGIRNHAIKIQLAVGTVEYNWIHFTDTWTDKKANVSQWRALRVLSCPNSANIRHSNI